MDLVSLVGLNVLCPVEASAVRQQRYSVLSHSLSPVDRRQQQLHRTAINHHLLLIRFARMRLCLLHALSLARPFSCTFYLKLSVQTLSDYKVLLPEAFLIQRSLYSRFLYSAIFIKSF